VSKLPKWIEEQKVKLNNFEADAITLRVDELSYLVIALELAWEMSEKYKKPWGLHDASQPANDFQKRVEALGEK